MKRNKVGRNNGYMNFRIYWEIDKFKNFSVKNRYTIAEIINAMNLKIANDFNPNKEKVSIIPIQYIKGIKELTMYNSLILSCAISNIDAGQDINANKLQRTKNCTITIEAE